MKRLLCIVSAMNTGGAETFLMKIYRNIDRSKYQMDFCVNSDDNYYENEIRALGGRIYLLPMKSKHPISSFVKLKKIVDKYDYNYVIRVNEHSLSTIDLVAAKLAGAKRVIMRSSNASSGSKIRIFLHKLFIFMSKNIPDVKIAPSKKAANYSFGNNCIENKKAFILHNGLDLDQYSFNEQKRKELRKYYGLDEKIVIGHIGRFSKQKNHEFLLDIFYEIQKDVQNAVLLLIGDGELINNIKEKTQNLNISHKVMFFYVRSDVSDLLNMMDMFLFPSLYEGMPNTIIEAQTNGLPCIISDSITDEVIVTDLVIPLPLNSSSLEWKSNCMKKWNSTKNNDRTIYSNIMKQKGYDIYDCTSMFCNLIFNE